MRANCWHGKQDIRVESVPEPKILNRRDAIVKISSTAICGSDLHLYNGYIPTMEKGDIMGHEFMGEIVELGPDVKNRKVGDRVVVAFPIACGSCYFCKNEMFSLCENTNPNAWMAEKLFGHAPAGIFGYSHLTGGYPGGQAEYTRVPFADIGTLPVPSGLSDEQVLFLSDIFPTGYMGAEMCNIKKGDTIAVWGCGPVGQFAIRSALLLGAERVIAIDRFHERLRMAKQAGAELINYENDSTYGILMERTGGRGPDACIDAVGLEAHGAHGLHGALFAHDKLKQSVKLEMDRPVALREAIMACRNGGIVSVIGVYGGLIDKFPLGSFMNRGLTMRTGQAHVQHYWKLLLERIERGEIDPSFVVTHRMNLDDAPMAFDMFLKKQDDCIKIVLKP